jgi:hypothetical protein
MFLGYLGLFLYTKSPSRGLNEKSRDLGVRVFSSQGWWDRFQEVKCLFCKTRWPEGYGVIWAIGLKIYGVGFKYARSNLLRSIKSQRPAKGVHDF